MHFAISSTSSTLLPSLYDITRKFIQKKEKNSHQNQVGLEHVRQTNKSKIKPHKPEQKRMREAKNMEMKRSEEKKEKMFQ